MATNPETTNTAPATTKEKPRIVGGLTPQMPKFFDSLPDAHAFLQQVTETYGDWAEHANKLIVTGMDSEGNVDPGAYPDGVRVMFHVLTNRGPELFENGKKVGRGPATVKAILIHPVPSIEQILADDQGAKWAAEKLNTQIVHVTVAKLRDSDNIIAAAQQMPGVVTSDDGASFDLASFFAQRESGALTATYDLLYKPLIEGYNQRSKLWARFKLNKTELRKALESKAYAAMIYGPLEDRPNGSLFVSALNTMIKSATALGHDPAILQTWLDTRDNATLDDSTDDENLDDLELELSAEDTASADVTPTDEATDPADSTETTADTNVTDPTE